MNDSAGVVRDVYIHYRFRNADGKVSNRGGYTVFYSSLPGDGGFVVGLAKCSLGDVFSARLGRAIARGRALKSGVSIMYRRAFTSPVSPEALERLSLEMIHADMIVQADRHGYSYSGLELCSRPRTEGVTA